MDNNYIKRVMLTTKLIRLPQQRIETFWSTEIQYSIVSKKDETSSILRQGLIICKKPMILSVNNFKGQIDGFSHEAVKYAELLTENELSRLKALGYQFKNELKKEVVIQIYYKDLLNNINKRISQTNSMAIIYAQNDIWSISLLKLLVDITSKSYKYNIDDLQDRGFFDDDKSKIETEIEQLFNVVKDDPGKIKALGQKLQQYDKFEEYEDRFFSLLKK